MAIALVLSENEAIKDIPAGQIVKSVVTVGNESYVVKVLEKNDKGFIPFDRVKAQLKTQVVSQEKQVRSQSYIQEVTDKYKLNKISSETVKIKKK